MSSEASGEFTKGVFLDYDQRRTTFGSRPLGPTAGQSPIPETERVLKVSIPYTPVWTRSSRGAYQLRLAPTEKQIEIDPCGYVELEYLDEYLRNRLCALGSIRINGPKITGSGRQLIDIDAPLYATLFEKAETAGDLSVPCPDPDKLTQMTNLLDAHERDPQIQGSHADTMLNPATRSDEVNSNIALMLGYSLSHTLNSFFGAPTRSAIYNELYAMTAERKNHPQLAERVALDLHRENVTDPTYSIALEILTWLRDEHRVSYGDMTNLLNMCRYFHTPMQSLCVALNDLADGMPIEDIPYNSSLFNHLSSGIDEYYNSLTQSFNLVNSSLSRRLSHTTFETLSLAEGKVVKEWWTRNPPSVFPLPIIRMLIHLRDMADWSEQKYDQPLITTTAPQRSLTQVDRSNLIYDGEVIAGLRYQDPRNSISQHPLRTAMSDSVSTERIVKLTTQRRNTTDRILSYWRTIGREVVRNKHQFNSRGDFDDWLTGAAPTDAGLGQVVDWFL